MERRRGFTFIELVVVLLVALILLGIGVAANYEIGRDQALAAAAGQLSADLRRAQGTAISQGKEAWLVLADRTGKTGGPGYRIYVQGDATPLEEVPLPENIAFDKADLNRLVRFGTLGEPQPSTTLRVSRNAPNPYYLILQSWDRSAVQRLTIQAGSGMVKIE